MDVASELENMVSSSPLAPRDLTKYVLSFDELAEMDIPKREFLLGRWLPKASFGMVYAERGHGKSWFYGNVGRHCTRLKHFLGWMFSANKAFFMSMEKWPFRHKGKVRESCQPNLRQPLSVAFRNTLSGWDAHLP